MMPCSGKREKNMTRTEYMNKLIEGLKDYDEEFAQDIIEDYRRHFDEAAKDGRSEQSVCEELGDVDEFLRDIPEELKKNPEDNTAAKNGNVFSGNVDIDLDKIVDKAGEIAGSAGKFIGSVAGVMGNAINRVGDYINKAINEAKDEEENSDTTDSFTSAKDGDYTGIDNSDADNIGSNLVLASYEGIDSLKLELVDADIEVCQGNSDALTVTLSRPLTKKEKLYFNINVDKVENTLTISHGTVEKMQYSFFKHEPITFYVNLPINMDKVKLSTVSGYIKATSEIRSNVCKLNTVSGNILFDYDYIGDKFTAETVSGSSKVNRVSVDKASLTSVSGSIDAMVSCDSFSANTVSGKILLAIESKAKGKIDTVSGSIKVGLVNDLGLDINASSMSGSLKIITDKEVKWDHIDENTVFFGFKQSGNKRAHFGEEGVSLKTNSVSGSVTVIDFDK